MILNLPIEYPESQQKKTERQKKYLIAHNERSFD